MKNIVIISIFSSLLWASDLHKNSIIIDGHNDLPWTLRSKGDSSLTKYDLRKPQPEFHTDIPRLVSGGMGAQFWSAYVPARLADSGEAYKVTLEQVDLIHRMVKKYPDVFEIALSSADVQRIRAQGKIASLIGLEGGHSIENSLEKLRHFYAMGARYMTLAHSKNLDWIESATDLPMPKGLTNFGIEVVKEMNRIGIFVDISHISAKAMREVLAVAKAPLIASHSSAYALTPHARNVPDDVLKLVAKNGGVVMVNFYSKYVTQGGGKATLKDVIDHIEHIAKIAGINHVGLGSDFDGVDELPTGLEDVSKLPNITAELLKRGYSESDVKKVHGLNLIRAFEGMEKAAEK